jgi:16S rRNA (cytosine1402-N4)-methyltransferase
MADETSVATTAARHVPVLPMEVLALLDPQPGQVFVDATVGAGGHARLLAERVGPGGRMIGLDRDVSMLKMAQAILPGSVVLWPRGFDELADVLADLGAQGVDGALADLGICSDQLDDPARGFSFQRDGPLDMRLDRTLSEPASELIRRLKEHELADIFWKYGEERHSRRIARRIVETRKAAPLTTTFQLAELVRSCVPRERGRKNPLDPATRVFQALRIAVNDEIGALERFLDVLPRCLRGGGRAAIISFHSLEDRLVKRAFRNKEHWQVLTKKPIRATDDEVRSNPRARSAKLRGALRVA